MSDLKAAKATWKSCKDLLATNNLALARTGLHLTNNGYEVELWTRSDKEYNEVMALFPFSVGAATVRIIHPEDTEGGA